MTVWIDIDNPPQARYLLPFVRRFEEAGHNVVLTARAAGETFAILQSEGASFEPIGSSFGRGIPRKAYGLTYRALKLLDFVQRQPGRFDLVLTGSRSATLVARRVGIPSFVIVDYEHVNLLLYRISDSHILYPSVIAPASFRRRGVRGQKLKLMPFGGLKEDLSFADVNVWSVPPYEVDGGNEPVSVLFRPPAEESHYYRSESRKLALELLRYLAAEGARIVFSPRLEHQIRYLDEVEVWHEDPIVLREPVHFVSLLKAVDSVVSAGGTMLREAAYLGVPAYSVFRSRIGAVDRYLASIDRLSLITSPADFPRIRLSKIGSISPLRQGSRVVDDVMTMILDRVGGATTLRRSTVRSTSVA